MSDSNDHQTILLEIRGRVDKLLADLQIRREELSGGTRLDVAIAAAGVEVMDAAISALQATGRRAIEAIERKK